MTEPHAIDQGRGGTVTGRANDTELAGVRADAARGVLAVRAFRALASDQSETLECRRDALLALARHRPAEAETLALFVGLLRSEPAAVLRWTAAMGLGRIGGTSAVRALERAAAEDFAEVGVHQGVPLIVADAAVAALSYLRSRCALRARLR
jgi:HEAT repeat protein